MDSKEYEQVKTYVRRSKFDYYTGQPGKKIRRSTHLKRKHAKQLCLGEFKFDLEENVDSRQKFLGMLRKKIPVILCDHSIASLIAEKNQIVSIVGLPLWTKRDVIVRDRDGKPLLYFLKDSLRRSLIKDQSLHGDFASESGKVKNEDPTQDGLLAIQDLVKDFPPSFPASDVRYDGKHVPGHGVHRLAFWHAQGHEHEPAMLSADMLGAKAAARVNVVNKFLKRFRKVLQAVGVIYEWIDRENYSRYRSLFQFFVEEGAVSLMQTTERNCFLGMSILTGVCVNPHRDSKDPLDGWAVNMAFGNFEGGYMEVPQIGYKFEVKPGDVVFMRSALLQHSISDTTSGLRFGVVLFNHEANFEEKKRTERMKMVSRIQNIQEKWLKRRSQRKEDTVSV